MFFLFFVGVFSFANAESVDRNSLILEYSFDGEIKNTSPRDSKLEIIWDIELWEVKNTSAKYWVFDTDRIVSTTWWSSDEYGKYTISFWYKWEKRAKNWYNHQTLLSSNKWDILKYSWWNSCVFFNTNVKNCNIFDWKWHHIIIRKSRKLNTVYIDFKLVYKKSAYVNPIGRNFVLWWAYKPNLRWFYFYPNENKNRSYWDRKYIWWWSYYYNSNWAFHNFRLYWHALSGKDMLSLHNESKLLYINKSEIHKENYYKDSISIWKIKDKSKYSISFEVQTNLKDRIRNENNRYLTRYTRVYADTPQVIFSWNNSSQTDKFVLILNKDYKCLTPYWEFDCSALKDEKNHLFRIEKFWNSNKIYIDDSLVFEKDSSLWNLWDSYITHNTAVNIWASYYYCGWYNTSWWKFCANGHKFFWKVEKVEFYDWILAEKQKKEIFDNFKWNESLDTTLRAKLLSFNDEQVKIEVTNLTNKYFLENTNYEYSFDWNTFSSFSSWAIVSSWTWANIKYTIDLKIPLSLWENVNLSLRTKKEEDLYKFFTVELKREIINYDIDIKNPDTSNSSSKTITASFPEGKLYMSITDSDFCHAWLAFEDYASLSFNSTKDNWKFVCYKWVHSSSKEIYKSSNQILGISLEEDTKKSWSSVFENYKTWRNSKEIKEDDSTYAMLSFIWVSNSNSSWRQSEVYGWAMLVDINWDGLVDLLYNNKNQINYTEFVVSWRNGYHVRKIKNVKYKAILVNNWDYTFKTVYKCVEDLAYYWNCAK